MFSFFKKKYEDVSFPKLHVCFKHANGKLPTRGHKFDAGLDLYLSGALTIKPRQGRTFPIGISVCIPMGFVGLILPRSSVSLKGVHVCTGVIDAGYVGEISISVNNMTNNIIRFEAGDRIAQLVLLPIALFDLCATTQDKLDKQAAAISNRGKGGYGSTGK